MRLLKPAWLSHSGDHKDFEVYSCHVSPDGKRLATAGGDGYVRVWSVDAILNSDTPGYRKPRQLCHMSHHLGTVHSVRFSPNGRYLASGADDKFICVYHLDSGPPTATFGTNEPPPVENWKTYKRLVGHDNDVQDLAWSPDSSMLVSVGLDSKVVIWSGHTFEKLKTLALHQSHVKGITFDPANKFFATASDDRTMKIVRYTPPPPNATQHDMANNFQLESTVAAPFKSSPLTTYFRRCSWSPDGNHVAAANAVNGPVNSVAIVERGDWNSEINLIGHEGPTEVCVFSPRLFMPVQSDNPAAAGSLVTVIACAGQDKTLTVWNTHQSRPLLIVQDLASKSVVDISWAPDGQSLFACSLDGSIVAVSFHVGELGWVARPEENDRALEKYGISRKGIGMAEDVEALRLETLSKADESRAAESRMGALMGDVAPSKGSTPVPNGGGGKQHKEKEREPLPANGASGVGGGDTAGPAVATAAAVVAAAAVGPADDERPDQESADQRAQRVKELKARVTIGKDGKKRVAPLLVSSSSVTGLSSLPQTQLVGSTTKTAQNDAPATILDLEQPYDGLPKGGIISLILGNKRRAMAPDATEDDVGEDGESPTTKVAAAATAAAATTSLVTTTADGTVRPVDPRAVTMPYPTPSVLRSAVTHPSSVTSSIRLGVPKIRMHVVRSLERGALQGGDPSLEEASRLPENTVFEARNPAQLKDPTAIVVSKRGALLWQDFVPRAVVLVTGNKFFWAAACEDGTLHIWSPAGRRLLNPIILEASPVILTCHNHWLLCVAAIGTCFVWDLRTQRSPHPPVSLAPVLEMASTIFNPHHLVQGPGITSASINSTGHIVVTLTNGNGFFYHRDMFTWQRVSEAWWAVGSQYWNSNDSSISALQSSAAAPAASSSSSDPSAVPVSAGIIPHLERHTTNEFLLKGRAYSLQRIVKTVLARDGYEGFESTVSIAHLENRIAAAMQLGSAEEFRLYLFMYAKRIGSQGLRAKVEELLAWLVGGLFEEGGEDDEDEEGRKNNRKKEEGRGEDTKKEPGRGWFSTGDVVCGWERRELLRGVVMILGKYRELQRLVVNHARLLSLPLDTDQAMDVEA